MSIPTRIGIFCLGDTSCGAIIKSVAPNVPRWQADSLDPVLEKKLKKPTTDYEA